MKENLIAILYGNVSELHKLYDAAQEAGDQAEMDRVDREIIQICNEIELWEGWQ